MSFPQKIVRKKIRKPRRKGVTSGGSLGPQTRLVWGRGGVYAKRHFQLSYKAFERFRVGLTRFNKKRGVVKWKWKFWLFLHSATRRSGKPKGSRMGKGAGKRRTWVTSVRPGRIFIEFRYARLGMRKRVLSFIRVRIPARVWVCTSCDQPDALGGSRLATPPQLTASDCFAERRESGSVKGWWAQVEQIFEDEKLGRSRNAFRKLVDSWRYQSGSCRKLAPSCLALLKTPLEFGQFGPVVRPNVTGFASIDRGGDLWQDIERLPDKWTWYDDFKQIEDSENRLGLVENTLGNYLREFEQS